MTDADHELLTVLSQVGNCFDEVTAGLLGDNLTRDEQISFGNQLVNLAERFLQRALKTGGMVVEGRIVVADHDVDAPKSDGRSSDCTIPPDHK